MRLGLLILLVIVTSAAWQWRQYQAGVPPATWMQKNLLVEGDIVTIPQQTALATKFYFKTRRVQQQRVSMLLSVSWYGASPSLVVGQRWRLTLRLKPVHGLQNFGQSNPHYYFLQQGIQASATVVSRMPAKVLQDKVCCRIARVRAIVQQRLQQAIANKTLAAIMAALTVGSRSLLSATEWQVFQNTGTSHLIAISGLHIGLIAAWSYWLCLLVWRCSATLVQWVIAPRAACVAAMLAAIIYSLLAGMSLPTERALIMIVVWMSAQLFSQPVPIGVRMALAFALILMVQPFSVLSASFWLSFVAVACLAYTFAARLQAVSGWRQWLRMQTVIGIGLMPLTLFYFQRISVLMWLANMIAIPWISFAVVPLGFIATLLSFFAPTIGQALFWLSGQTLAPLWQILHAIAALPWVLWWQPVYAPWIMLAACIGVIWLLAPRGWPMRWLGVLWLLPLFFYLPPRPAPGEVWLTVLDVGQGLASVIQTAQHTLVYDTGPRYPGGFDAGARVVVPYLRYRGILNLNTIVISHGDNDHLGGAASVLAAMPVDRLITSVPEKMPPAQAKVVQCFSGQHWRWDGVDFEVLAPDFSFIDSSANNRSCVLRVRVAGGALLLPGDIEKNTERWLVRNRAAQLKATVLVAPHHGSKTSSTDLFVQNVHPDFVVMATGFYNRFRFPSHAVLQRYQRSGAQILNTAHQGAVLFRLSASGGVKLATFAP